MIQVYLLAVGELRRQMEKNAAALPGWDKLADWQQEKISRCAAPGTRALCMGGQLLLQYGAREWSAGGAVVFDVSDARPATEENGISWRVIEFSRLTEYIAAPQPLAAAYEPGGKPYIRHVPWHYNLSHSGDYAALAISDVPVGIDIQQMRPYRDSLVKRFFAAEEAAVYESLVPMDVQGQNTLFYTLWCRKEAYGKLLGTGLTEEVLKCNMLEDTGVNLYEYGELPGYRICVCGGMDRAG